MVEVLAPAKVNLTLHVTGRRADGYHLLDSLVMFADMGDRIRVREAEESTLTVTGPMARGVPVDERNLVLQAAATMGATGHFTLDKHLPHAAGLGGGSADAAATLRALSVLTGRPLPEAPETLGADVPVCLSGVSARMRGVGEELSPLPGLPRLHALLVNPNLPVLTAEVFKRLAKTDNPPMPEEIPQGLDRAGMVAWLARQRNDLEAAAIAAEPVIAQVFQTLEVTPGCQLTRMSGSGGTCFGLYMDAETAHAAQGRLRQSQPGWWSKAVVLGG
jgi:4-diphosphocytidyl-2-C-methyl-D-erythritol kinase